MQPLPAPPPAPLRHRGQVQAFARSPAHMPGNATTSATQRERHHRYGNRPPDGKRKKNKSGACSPKQENSSGDPRCAKKKGVAAGPGRAIGRVGHRRRPTGPRARPRGPPRTCRRRPRPMRRGTRPGCPSSNVQTPTASLGESRNAANKLRPRGGNPPELRRGVFILYRGRWSSGRLRPGGTKTPLGAHRHPPDSWPNRSSRPGAGAA